ncbi:hypothetical protein JKP88DRAFT_234877, partial [Tribonema minus]
MGLLVSFTKGLKATLLLPGAGSGACFPSYASGQPETHGMHPWQCTTAVEPKCGRTATWSSLHVGHQCPARAARHTVLLTAQTPWHWHNVTHNFISGTTTKVL